MSKESNLAKGLEIISRIPEAQRVLDEWNDMKDFSSWFQDDPDMLRADIASAIHETVHGLRNTETLFLVNGDRINVCEDEDANVPEPYKVIWPFVKRDFPTNEHVINYVKNPEESASSAQYFSYLMDEFNAYCHDLNVHIQCGNLPILTVPRDGVTAFMMFSAIYCAKSGVRLSKPQAELLCAIWEQAEDIVERSAKIKGIGSTTPRYLEVVKLFAGSIEQYLGRPVREIYNLGAIGEVQPIQPGASVITMENGQHVIRGDKSQRPVVNKYPTTIVDYDDDDEKEEPEVIDTKIDDGWPEGLPVDAEGDWEQDDDGTWKKV